MIQNYAEHIGKLLTKRVEEIAKIADERVELLFELDSQCYVLTNNIHVANTHLLKLVEEMEGIQKVVTDSPHSSNSGFFEQAFEKLNKELVNVLNLICKKASNSIFLPLYILSSFFFLSSR